MAINTFLAAFFAFFALVNPLQKLFVVMSLRNNYDKIDLHKIINRSNRTALEVLIIFMLAGEAVLGYVFNLEIYAFQITCGGVLLYNGFMGLQKGAVLPIDGETKLEDIIVVPIAVPMIAGPATITAAVSMPSMYGMPTALIAIILAIAINWVVMRNAAPIASFMNRYNILMPLIRIMGLIVAAVGTQMVFNGIGTFVGQLAV